MRLFRTLTFGVRRAKCSEPGENLRTHLTSIALWMFEYLCDICGLNLKPRMMIIIFSDSRQPAAAAAITAWIRPRAHRPVFNAMEWIDIHFRRMVTYGKRRMTIESFGATPQHNIEHLQIVIIVLWCLLARCSFYYMFGGNLQHRHGGHTAYIYRNAFYYIVGKWKFRKVFSEVRDYNNVYYDMNYICLFRMLWEFIVLRLLRVGKEARCVLLN